MLPTIRRIVLALAGAAALVAAGRARADHLDRSPGFPAAVQQAQPAPSSTGAGRRWPGRPLSAAAGATPAEAHPGVASRLDPR